MKKLIINEKNLPKLGKPSELNTKFRIKNPAPPTTITQGNKFKQQAKKQKDHLLQTQIHQVIQAIQAHIFKSQQLSQQTGIKAINFLKIFKQSQANIDPMLTQSLKFSKVKLKFSEEDKQNSIKKVQSSSQRQRQMSLKQKPLHSSNIRKITLPYKKSTQKHQITQPDSPIISWERQRVKLQKQTNTQSLWNENQYIKQIQDSKDVKKMKDVKEEVKLQEKQKNIEELNERIQQLNSNIQSLLKKHSLKSQQMQKACIEKGQLAQKIQLIQNQITQLQSKNKDLLKQLEGSAEKQKQQLQIELNIQQELKLQPTNLKSQNEVLLERLKERQEELLAVWNTINSKTETIYQI